MKSSLATNMREMKSRNIELIPLPQMLFMLGKKTTCINRPITISIAMYEYPSIKDSNVPNNFVVPGYQGFLPSVRSQSLYGKGTTPTSKEALTSDRLDYNKTGIASTGFNVKREDFIDKSQNGFSSKYGKTALQKAHPNWSVKIVLMHRNNGKLVFKSVTRTQNQLMIPTIGHQKRDH